MCKEAFGNDFVDGIILKKICGNFCISFLFTFYIVYDSILQRYKRGVLYVWKKKGS